MTMTTAEYPAGIPPRPTILEEHLAEQALRDVVQAEQPELHADFTPIYRIVGRKMLSSILQFANY